VVTPRPIAELVPQVSLHLGKTADWVAITADAVWVGSTGPYAVHRIDPLNNREIATVRLPGEPCAGLATGFNALWIPLCGRHPSLARVDLTTNALKTFRTGPAGPEGGVATTAAGVWMVLDRKGTLARIDPERGKVQATVKVAPGSYNPRFSEGLIWVTRADGAELTAVEPESGKVLGSAKTGPGPRFLTDGDGVVWTLNQGDGSLSAVDARTRETVRTVALGIPGHGGDIAFFEGKLWVTMPKVPLSMVEAGSGAVRCQWEGPGGDSLAIGHGAIWLTDYQGGTVSRIVLADAVQACATRAPSTSTQR
jgi:streptogramin lyase